MLSCIDKNVFENQLHLLNQMNIRNRKGSCLCEALFRTHKDIDDGWFSIWLKRRFSPSIFFRFARVDDCVILITVIRNALIERESKRFFL